MSEREERRGEVDRGVKGGETRGVLGRVKVKERGKWRNSRKVSLSITLSTNRCAHVIL